MNKISPCTRDDEIGRQSEKEKLKAREHFELLSRVRTLAGYISAYYLSRARGIRNLYNVN